MDISKVDLNYIELFALAYSIAEDIFGVEPVKANTKKQRQIRKWVKKTYINQNDLPQKVLGFVGDSKSDEEVIEFLAECSRCIEEKGTWKHQLLEKVTVDFTQDVKNAFEYLFETLEFCESIEVQANKVIISLDEMDSYKRRLVLHTSKENSVSKYEWFDFSEAQILKDGEGYKLICIASDFEEDISLPITIWFDRATTEIDIYSADEQHFYGTPWEYLELMAHSIVSKGQLGDEYFNIKERGLMPLLKELRSLSNLGFFHMKEQHDFENLKNYIKRHELNHLLPLLGKVIEQKRSGKDGVLRMNFLNNRLNESICEGLWRELYQLVKETQEGYVKKSDSYNPTKLCALKMKIEEGFHKLGYMGKYPTFRKNGAMKGFRLEYNYNMSYFVGVEKNVDYVVHCREVLDEDTLAIQFLCGTAFLKKDETIEDIYSCCFNKKGRRLFKEFLWDVKETEILDEMIIVAAKKAECTKLSKREKVLSGGKHVSVGEFISTFVVMGGLFAILMTIAEMLILCVMTIIFDGFSGVKDMIVEMPWGILFAIGFVGFGGAMAIIEAKAQEK